MDTLIAEQNKIEFEDTNSNTRENIKRFQKTTIYTRLLTYPRRQRCEVTVFGHDTRGAYFPRRWRWRQQSAQASGRFTLKLGAEAFDRLPLIADESGRKPSRALNLGVIVAG